MEQAGEKYISLPDMIKAKDGEFLISDWLRKRNTVEFLGKWESVYNPDLNGDGFKDILIGNYGLKSKLTASREYPLEMYSQSISGIGYADQVLTV